MAKKKHHSYLIVDGYNIINDWEELKALSVEDLDAARERLIHYIIEYSQYHGKRAIVVFDAYNVKGGAEHQTADSYIEKFISTLSKYDKIQVATSDYAEQQIILGKGATRISARELKLYLDETLTKIKEKQQDNKKRIQRNFLEDRLDDITLSKLENIRRKH